MANKLYHFGSKYLKLYNSTNICFMNLLFIKQLISVPSVNLIGVYQKTIERNQFL